LIFPETFSGKVYHILDQEVPYSTGVIAQELSSAEVALLGNKTILGFYSACQNKPHRFQFIYSNKGYDKKDDESFPIAR
jgi:hypothetical protein